MEKASIGIDISKDLLEVHALPSGDSGRFANTADRWP
jgi:hypothetical protein